MVSVKSMSPAPQLPYELLDNIVLSLPTVSARKACTLVSRSWAAAAYPRVFRCIKLSECMLVAPHASPARGRYCVKRLLNFLLTCSHFLPLCVKELYLDTFDSDGFTFGQFKQVLDRFPGIEVVGYNVRHFVLSPPSPSEHEEEFPPPSLPISPGRRFSKVHISIGEYGTASALAQYISLFDPDCVDELSIGHLEVEEDRLPATFGTPVRAHTVIKEHSGRVTEENMRVLHTVLDGQSIQSIIDETDGGRFIRSLNLRWHLPNVRRLATWFSENYDSSGVPRSMFYPEKFPNLRTLDVTLEFRRSPTTGLSSWEPFEAFVEVLDTAPSTLSDIVMKVVMVNLPERPVDYPVVDDRMWTSTYYNMDLFREICMLDWNAFKRVIQKLSRAGCRPSLGVDIVAQDKLVKPDRYCRTQSLSLAPHPLANTNRVNSILRDVVMSSIMPASVRERMTVTAILHPDAQ